MCLKKLKGLKNPSLELTSLEKALSSLECLPQIRAAVSSVGRGVAAARRTGLRDGPRATDGARAHPPRCTARAHAPSGHARARHGLDTTGQ